MAMNPMQRKARTSFILGMFVTLILTGIVIALLVLQINKMKKAEEQVVYKTVYVSVDDIKSGDTISGKIKEQKVRADACPNNALDRSNIGDYIFETTISKLNLTSGTIITTEMGTEPSNASTNDVRLQEYNMIVLPSQLEDGEYIDIRLRIPSGEDYIILSKKKVEQSNADTIWLQVNESEILLMSSATVEAYIMEGAYLYATTYVEAGMQDAAALTYVPSDTVRGLLTETDDNVTAEARDALRQRYQGNVLAFRARIDDTLRPYYEDDETTSQVSAGTTDAIERQQTARQDYVAGL